jgi:hypothetical protein
MTVNTGARPRVPPNPVPWILAAAGLLAVVIALAIGAQKYGPGGTYTLSEANGICASAFGQAAQVSYARAHANCAAVGAEEQTRGWLLIGGVVVAAAGAGWAGWRHRPSSAVTSSSAASSSP